MRVTPDWPQNLDGAALLLRSVPLVAWLILLLCVPNGPLAAQARENKDYCLPRAQVVVLLVDITTPYDQTDKDAIISMVDEALRIIKGGQRLIIRTIADSHTTGEKLIERCMPHCPSQGLLGPLFNCSDGLIRTDNERTRLDIIGSLKNRLNRFEELSHSDIIRTFVSLSLADMKGVEHVKLFVFSDLIENSDHITGTQLFRVPTKDLIDKLRKQQLIASLSNAEVRVAGVGRAATPGKRPLTVSELGKLKEFWTAYFTEGRSRLVEIGQHVARVPN